MKLNNLFKIISLFLLMLLPPSSANAQKAQLTDLKIQNSGEDLLVSAKLQVNWNKKITEPLQSGMDVNFVYIINLYQKYNWRWDKKLCRKKVYLTAQYDNLSNQYKLCRIIDADKVTTTVHDHLLAKEWLTNLKPVRIISLAELNPQNAYYLKLNTHMTTFKPPTFLQYLLFFIPFYDFETPNLVSSTFKVPYK
ncbi:MAG: DUF4390 domain-containing protein [Candidatus Schekmanbacteria bacterium]|nr:DUF4390 domain-containing protein [Candidatus Schekmanbacteria bacterium]